MIIVIIKMYVPEVDDLILLILPKSMRDNDYTIHRFGFIPLIHEFFVAIKRQDKNNS